MLLLSFIINVLIPYALSASTYCGTTNYPSPIDLTTADAKQKSCCEKSEAGSAKSLHSIWSVESQSMRFRVDRSNTQTLKLQTTKPISHPPTLSIDGIQYCYDGTIEFHWGKDNKGSEHQLNNKQYAMEAHYIHYQCNLNSVKEALDHWVTQSKENANTTPVLAIVAILFELSDKKNYGMNKILRVIHTAKKHDIIINPFKDGLLPKHDTGFLNYHGSTTDSQCYPIVNWIIADSAHGMIIHSEQLEQLRTLTGIDSNWKAVQDSKEDIFSCTCLKASKPKYRYRRLAADCDSNNGDHHSSDSDSGDYSGCDDDNGDYSDEMGQFIRQFESVCSEVDGLVDHEVFQSAINQMLDSVPDLNSDHKVFEKAYQFHVATVAAWQSLRENCEDASAEVQEELRRLAAGRKKIIENTRQKDELQRSNQLAKFEKILPHLHELRAGDEVEVDCVDCEGSTNEGLSNVATSLNKLQHLGNANKKVKSAMLDAMFDVNTEGPNIHQMLSIISDKMAKKSKEAALFQGCMTLAYDKIDELENQKDFGGIQQELLDLDEAARNATEGLLQDTAQTFFELINN